MSTVCTLAAPCDYHRDGGNRRHKCYGMCDRRGCRETIDTGVPGAKYCDRHAERRGPGRPVSTGSAATPPVAFRVGAEEYARAERAAKRERVTVGELARRALLGSLLD